MKWSKKALTWLLVSLMLVLSLAACGSQNSPSTTTQPAGETTTAAPTEATTIPKEPVTVITSLSEGELNADQIAQFESENPLIKLKLEQLDGAKLAAELATNTAPDVIRMSGAFETSSYVIKGIAMDITKYIESSTVIKMDDLLPVVNVFRFDGKNIGQGPIYGLPKDWSNDYAIFYNKRCFDAAGVAVPDSNMALTWPEVMELAKKLTITKDGKVSQYGLSATEWGQTQANFNIMMQYIVSAGGKISSDDNKTMNFDIQPVRDFLSMWVDACKSNVGPNALNNDQTSGGDLFLSDRSAMLIDGYWYSGVVRGNENAKAHLDDFGMLPTPTAPGGQRIAATGGATGCIIYKNSKNPDEVWKFFEWYFGGKPADDRAATGWGMPIFKSKLALLPQVTNFDKRVLAVLQDESDYQQSFLPVNPYLAGGGWGIFDKYFTPLIFGKETIDGAVQGMTKDANAAVTEAMNAIN